VPEAWELPISTAIGSVRWRKVADPFGGRKLWYAVLGEPEAIASEKTVVPRRPLLLGFLSVEDPETVDDDLRRPQDPVDRRIDVIWLHPDVRDQGVGGALRDVAERHGLFESHSDVRTDAGSRWAAGGGEALPPPGEVPEPVKFEAGGRRSYRRLLAENPDFDGLLLPDDEQEQSRGPRLGH
jgi:hypothetical protein